MMGRLPSITISDTSKEIGDFSKRNEPEKDFEYKHGIAYFFGQKLVIAGFRATKGNVSDMQFSPTWPSFPQRLHRQLVYESLM